MNEFIPCFSNLKTKSLPPWGFFQPTPPSAPPKAYCGDYPGHWAERVKATGGIALFLAGGG